MQEIIFKNVSFNETKNFTIFNIQCKLKSKEHKVNGSYYEYFEFIKPNGTKSKFNILSINDNKMPKHKISLKYKKFEKLNKIYIEFDIIDLPSFRKLLPKNYLLYGDNFLYFCLNNEHFDDHQWKFCRIMENCSQNNADRKLIYYCNKCDDQSKLEGQHLKCDHCNDSVCDYCENHKKFWNFNWQIQRLLLIGNIKDSQSILSLFPKDIINLLIKEFIPLNLEKFIAEKCVTNEIYLNEKCNSFNCGFYLPRTLIDPFDIKKEKEIDLEKQKPLFRYFFFYYYNTFLESKKHICENCQDFISQKLDFKNFKDFIYHLNIFLKANINMDNFLIDFINKNSSFY